MGRSMTRGDCGETEIGIRRDSTELKLKVKRVAMADDNSARITHDLPGPTLRLFSKDVAYLKLSSVKAQDAVHYVDQAAGTKGLIIDIRNYPPEFMVFALGSLLVDSDTPLRGSRKVTCRTPARSIGRNSKCFTHKNPTTQERS